MKRLFLTSKGLSALSDFIGKNPKDVKVAFVPTAADTYKDKWFVELDRDFFKHHKFQLIEVDIKDKVQLDKLRGVDLIHIAGGNSFYLLEKAIESGALDVIRELVNNGTLYSGSSAGAVFAGPTIEPVALLDHPEEARILKTYQSLGLVDFVVLPHYGSEKYEDRYKKIMEKYKNTKIKLEVLTDRQAIIVEDNEYRIVEST